MKLYLGSVSIARDGGLVVRHSQPFVLAVEPILMLRSDLDSNPSCHEFQLVLPFQLFDLVTSDSISRVTSVCHICASLKSFSSSMISQSSADPSELEGVSFAVAGSSTAASLSGSTRMRNILSFPLLD